MKPILVVGAGFAGAVHARELAEAGYTVHVIDRRPHIAGNAYDFVNDSGIRLHAYGPHLFHTKNKRVIAWIERFGAFTSYTHKVRALLPDGARVPMPINRRSVNQVFGTSFTDPAEVEAFLRSVALPIAAPENAAEHLNATIGTVLTDLFFRPYTKKMWQMDLEELSAAVVKRVPLRTNDVDTYFADDDVQMMPVEGFTSIFRAIFDHPNITVALDRAFEPAMQQDYAFCFNSMPIDEYFEYRFGELPYRSLRFHHQDIAAPPPPQDWAVTNFTDTGPMTRETAWHVLPHHVVEDTGRYTLTREEPCDYRENGMERYYPVKTADDRYTKLYLKYREAAEAVPGIAFIGRCGTYQYLDMDQVINQSLASVTSWIGAQAA